MFTNLSPLKSAISLFFLPLSPLSFPNQPLSDLNWYSLLFLIYCSTGKHHFEGFSKSLLNLFYNNTQITKHKYLFSILFLLGSIWHPTTFFRELGPFSAPLMPLSSKLVNLFSTLAGFSSITSPSPQFSSVAQSCLTLCNPMVCSTPRLPCPSPTPRACSNSGPSGQWCHPTISHPLSSPCLTAFNPSPHQGLFQWGSSSHHVAKMLEFQLQHQSFQWIFRTDFL